MLEANTILPAVAVSGQKDPPRLVQRNLAFHQSRNILQVAHNKGFNIGRLIRHDYFHVLLRLPLWKIVMLIIFSWTVVILFFAGVYYANGQMQSNPSCALGLNGTPVSFATAFAFSLETCSTVGYGLPNGSNAFFEACPALQSIIFFQQFVSILFNALLIGVILARIATSENRSVQVVFSNKAIVSLMNGQVRFQIRVFDVDAKHPVVEAHVRLYAVKKDRPVPRPLRTIQPNDELNGMLFLSLPQVICHHIDLYSILHPPRIDNPLDNNFGLNLRQVDSSTCNREEVICPICSESFGTHDRWVRHVQYLQLVERKDEFPVEGSHLAIRQQELDLDRFKPTKNLTVIKQHFLREISEVICVVEGIDPLTSGTFTALHSYMSTDIIWENGALFHPCISAESDLFRVDLDRFHQIDRKPDGRQQQMSIRPHDGFVFEEELGITKQIRIPERIIEE